MAQSSVSELQISVARDPAELVELNALYAAWSGEAQGTADFLLYIELDPDGCLVGKIAGEAVTILHAVRYNESFAFMGSFVTKPVLRGKGLGREIWNAGMLYCGSRTIGLYSADYMVKHYTQRGFGQTDKILGYRTKDTNRRFDNPNEIHLVETSTVPIQVVADFDRKYFPADRTKFLEAWIKQPGSVCLSYVVDGKLRGYGLIKQCRDDGVCRIGPVHAENLSYAITLLKGLLNSTKGVREVYFYTVAQNPTVREFAESVGSELVEDAAVMFRGDVPPYDSTGIYAFASGVVG